MTRFWTPVSALLLVALACAAPGDSPEAPESAPATRGSAPDAVEESVGRLVIIGGALAEGNEPVYRAILDGRMGSGPICVFPTASGAPAESMASAISRIQAFGGPDSAEGILVTTDNPEAAGDPAVVRRIRECGGFYFSGGSQSRISEVFRPDGGSSPALEAIRDRWETGAVVSGTSAGAAIMSDPMISGGGSVEAILAGVAAAPEADGVRLMPGPGFAPELLVDQHFLARGRIGRLVVATASDRSADIGVGIDENTAIVLEGRALRVVGESGVVVVRDVVSDVSACGTRGPAGELFLLGPRDGMDLDTGEIAVDTGKTPIGPTGAAVYAPADPFEDYEFHRMLASLAQSSDDSAVCAEREGAGLWVQRTAETEAFRSPGTDERGLPVGLWVGPVRIGVGPR
jgi:cyanophycinase